MREAGITWVRTDFDWSGVEPRQGQWRFQHLDEVVGWAGEAGICLLPILDYDVPWARPAYQHLDAWLAYVRAVVGRYKDRLRHWEVWNEPNLEGFWRERPDPANYVVLLRATYQEIKKIDPGLTLLLGGTAGIPWEFIEGIYKNGGKDYFDIMNVHPYRYPRGPEESRFVADLERLRSLMDRYGDSTKPIWITEIGWPTHQGPRGVSELVQAQMLARTYLLALHHGVEKVFWYEFQAPEGKADYNEDHFGIVHRDLSPKPAYQAYRVLAAVRPAGSKATTLWSTGGIYGLGWVTPDGQSVWAVWAPEAEKQIRLQVSEQPQRLISFLGEETQPVVQDKILSLTVGPGVLYIMGAQRVSLVE
jgi:hypothetical protein